MHCQVDEVVCNVEAGRAGVADVVEIILTLGEGARVDHFAFCEEDQLVEEGCDVGSRLVDRKHYCAVEVSC